MITQRLGQITPLGEDETWIDDLDVDLNYAITQALEEVLRDLYLQRKDLTQKEWTAIINRTYVLLKSIQNETGDRVISDRLASWGYKIKGKSMGLSNVPIWLWIVGALAVVVVLQTGKKK